MQSPVLGLAGAGSDFTLVMLFVIHSASCFSEKVKEIDRLG